MKGVPKKTAIKDHPYTVHYVWTGANRGECRPAVVVRDWVSCVNLAVFTDGTNDGEDRMVVWATSVEHSADGREGTYHHQGECEAAMAARAAAEASPTPPEEAPRASSSGDSAGGGAEAPTLPSPSGSGPSGSSGTQGGTDSPSPSVGDSPDASSNVSTEPWLGAARGMSQDEFHPVVPTALLTNQPAPTPEGGDGQ